MSDEQRISQVDAAYLLGITEGYVRKLIKSGTLPEPVDVVAYFDRCCGHIYRPQSRKIRGLLLADVYTYRDSDEHRARVLKRERCREAKR
jgi:hypothetical protein